ncbi:HAD family hydrolase [Streptomyces sp. CA-111067]|uniref:HAD family hydrolase n=1 Tax=Streptomyces sp. CA-111067 TaxID=3240046 RepID=UPI003D956219
MTSSPSAGFDMIAVDWAGTLTLGRHRPDAHLVRQVLTARFGLDISAEFDAIYDERFWHFYEQSLSTSLADLLAAVGRLTGTVLPQMSDLTEAIWDACSDHDLDPLAADALRELEQRYQVPVWLATNTCRPPEHRARSLVRAGLEFVNPLCSSAIGAAKPDPLFYRELAARSGIAPGRTLFIGDRLVPDVLGPADAGMRTVWINGATDYEAAEHPVPPATITVPHLSHLPALLAGGNR